LKTKKEKIKKRELKTKNEKNQPKKPWPSQEVLNPSQVFAWPVRVRVHISCQFAS